MQRKSGETPWIVKPFSFTAGLIQKAYSGLSSGVRGTTALYLDLVDIKKENHILRNEKAKLKAQLGELTELKLENERLNQLLDFKRKSKMDLLPAKVIGKDLIPEHNTITINRGTHHGIQHKMAAITVGGVVGYVFRPERYTSQIILLTDRYAVVSAIVQRSRARGIVEGWKEDRCQLNNLKRDDDVQKGDLVVTSGMDNIFPKGFPVARVKKVSKEPYSVTQEVEVEPVVNPSNLEEIFIVLNTNQETFEKPDKETLNPPEQKASSQQLVSPQKRSSL